MTAESFFICDCGSTILAISHTWKDRTDYEEIGSVGEDGRYRFDKPTVVDELVYDHEWIAYCGGCGQGVTVEWLSENRIRLLLQDAESK